MIKSNAFCPVSSSLINERVARLNAGFTFILLMVFLLTGSIIPVIILAADFLARSSGRSELSLLARLSKTLADLLSLQKSNINAGPKIFAARIGFLFSILIVLSILINSPVLAYTLTAVLGLFSFLEAVMGICVACSIYPHMYRFIYKSGFQHSSGTKSISYSRFGNQ